MNIEEALIAATDVIMEKNRTIERLTRELDQARQALERIASSCASDMNTPHPEHCAAIARAALPPKPEEQP